MVFELTVFTVGNMVFELTVCTCDCELVVWGWREGIGGNVNKGVAVVVGPAMWGAVNELGIFPFVCPFRVGTGGFGNI